MASVSTNKLGSLAEQSVEEPTSGAPKLEAMVEVKFKVRQLAVLLQAEENVSPMPAASASKTTKATVTTVRPTNLHHEARHIKVERSIESTTFQLGQRTESSCLQNQAVQCKSAFHEVKTQINNENSEFPVHDWGVPANFVVDLPQMLRFEQHLSEARRLESALVLVKPTKLLAFQQTKRERTIAQVLVDVLDDTKLHQESNTRANGNLRQTTIQIGFAKEHKEISNETPCEPDDSPAAFQGITITELPNELENCVQVQHQSLNSAKLGSTTTTTTMTTTTTTTTTTALEKSFHDFKQQAPQKFKQTLTAALDLALLGQPKFQLRWQRSDAKAQWPFQQSIIETRPPKSFTKWETSESLQLLRSKKKVTSKLCDVEHLAQKAELVSSASDATTAQIKVFKEHLGEGAADIQETTRPTTINVGEVEGNVAIDAVELLPTSQPTTADEGIQVEGANLFAKPPTALHDARERISTFFDLKILEDNLSLSEESDTDYLSEPKSSPEAPLTVQPQGFDSQQKHFQAQLQALKPSITHDRFLVKLLEDLSATEADIDEQQVELLYIRKAPFVEEDDERCEQLQVSAKPRVAAGGSGTTKYLMGLLAPKTSSEDDLIEIDAESDDWDEELDPEIDRIEFFDSDEPDLAASGELATVETKPPVAQTTKHEISSASATKVCFGNITKHELHVEHKATKVGLPRFRVVPNTPKPKEPLKKCPTFVHDDERPSCSQLRSEASTTWYPVNYKKIPAMTFENESINYQSELQSVLQKIRLLSEIDELDQSCVYEESDTEQRLYMKNGEWFATEPSESDEESRNEKRTTLDKELQSLSDADSPRALFNESLSAKRCWMLSELRKRFGLRMAKYDPTKKRPGMIIDSENWEEAYSESTFWNAHKNSVEKVRVLAKKGRFKFAIISEARRSRKAETSDEGEQSDKSSSEDERDNGKALRRKHSSFEIRQANCKRNDDGEVFFQPINGRGALGEKCQERRWALPPSRVYRFSRSFGRILKLHMKRPDLETILEEREPNDEVSVDEDCNVEEEEEEELLVPLAEAKVARVEATKSVELDFVTTAPPVMVKIRKKPERGAQEFDCISDVGAIATTVERDDASPELVVDWYYCFFNDHSDEPMDEDYFGDLSDFE